MKTPMKELLDKINNEEFDHLDDCKMFIQEYMLEKEKEQMCQFAFDYQDLFYNNGEVPPVREFYNETFNTKRDENNS